jgi:DNA-binding IclR family transcriptional regulator
LTRLGLGAIISIWLLVYFLMVNMRPLSEPATVQSLARGLDILRLISESPEGVALRDLVAMTGLKAPALHKLAATLVARGFAEKTRKPIRYRLGPAAAQLANAQWESALAQEATVAIRELRKTFPAATVTLCEAIGGEVMMTLRMSPERPGFLERPINRAMNAWTSASALAMQAFWTEEEREAYRARHPLWEQSGKTWESEEEADAFLADVRTLGYASPDIKQTTSFLIATPVFGANGVLRAALGVSIRNGKHEIRDTSAVIDTVIETAARLSKCGELAHN